MNQLAIEPIWLTLLKAGYERDALRIKAQFDMDSQSYIKKRARELSKQLRRKAKNAHTSRTRCQK